MQKLEKLDCVVLGNEPAGLWILQKLSNRTVAGTEGRMNLGWIPHGNPAGAIPTPTRIAPWFGLKPESPWFCDILSQKERWQLNAASLGERYPKVDFQSLLPTLAGLTMSQRATARRVLSRFPELLTLAKGVLKSFVPTEDHNPETALFSFLYCLEFFDWNPAVDLAQNSIQISRADRDVITGIEKTKGNRLAIHFSNHTVWFTDTLVINLDYQTLLKQRESVEFLKTHLALDGHLFSETALFPLTLECEAAAIPKTINPHSFWFEDMKISNPANEVLPLQVRSYGKTARITVWVTQRADVGLERLQEELKQSVARLYKIFPFLEQGLVRFDIPLYLGSCYPESTRQHFVDLIEMLRQHRFATIRTNARTRHPALHLFAPNAYGYHPHPLGTLILARDLMKQLVKVKRLRPMPPVDLLPIPVAATP